MTSVVEGLDILGGVARWPDLPYLPENGGLALPWFPASELLGLETGEESWLVERLIPAETINMLVGNPGTGKSLLVLDLLCSIATGKDFLGRRVRRGPVMYLAAEDGWRRVAKRLRQWAAGQGLAPAALADCYVLPSGLQIAAGEGIDGEAMLAAWEQLRADIEAVAPVLVVLDPLVDIHQGLDENKASEMAALMRVLRRLVRGQDRSLLLTHHDRKGSLEPSVYSARGSGALGAGVDGQYHMVAVKREEGEDEALAALLHVTKGRDLPPALKRPIGMRYQEGRWYVDEGVRDARREKEIGALRGLYDWLVGQGRDASIREAQLGVGVSYNTAQGYLERLVDLGAAFRAVERPARFLANPGARGRIA